VPELEYSQAQVYFIHVYVLYLLEPNASIQKLLCIFIIRFLQPLWLNSDTGTLYEVPVLFHRGMVVRQAPDRGYIAGQKYE
jgi:hypothetical protein